MVTKDTFCCPCGCRHLPRPILCCQPVSGLLCCWGDPASPFLHCVHSCKVSLSSWFRCRVGSQIIGTQHKPLYFALWWWGGDPVDHISFFSILPCETLFDSLLGDYEKGEGIHCSLLCLLWCPWHPGLNPSLCTGSCSHCAASSALSEAPRASSPRPGLPPRRSASQFCVTSPSELQILAILALSLFLSPRGTKTQCLSSVSLQFSKTWLMIVSIILSVKIRSQFSILTLTVKVFQSLALKPS